MLGIDPSGRTRTDRTYLFHSEMGIPCQTVGKNGIEKNYSMVCFSVYRETYRKTRLNASTE